MKNLATPAMKKNGTEIYEDPNSPINNRRSEYPWKRFFRVRKRTWSYDYDGTKKTTKPKFRLSSLGRALKKNGGPVWVVRSADLVVDPKTGKPVGGRAHHGWGTYRGGHLICYQNSKKEALEHIRKVIAKQKPAVKRS
jgi:hypothetical protein